MQPLQPSRKPLHLSIGCLAPAVHVACRIYVHPKLQRLSLLVADGRQALQLSPAEEAGKDAPPRSGCAVYRWPVLPVVLQEGGGILQSEGRRMCN